MPRFKITYDFTGYQTFDVIAQDAEAARAGEWDDFKITDSEMSHIHGYTLEDDEGNILDEDSW